MKILSNHTQIVCEIKGCANDAKYKLVLDDNCEYSVCLCEKCLNEFYRAASEAVKKEEANKAVAIKEEAERGETGK